MPGNGRPDDWDNILTDFSVRTSPDEWCYILRPGDDNDRFLIFDGGRPIRFQSLTDAMRVADMIAKAWDTDLETTSGG